VVETKVGTVRGFLWICGRRHRGAIGVRGWWCFTGTERSACPIPLKSSSRKLVPRLRGVVVVMFWACWGHVSSRVGWRRAGLADFGES